MAVVMYKKQFTVGVVLAVTFLILLLMIYTRVFFSIDGKSVVNYTDEMFVSVSKGSVYFIPAIRETIDKQVGKPFEVTIKGDEKASLLFQKANARVERKDGRLTIKGDLGQILGAALKDADLVFKGEDKELRDRYGYPGKAAVRSWWVSLKAIEKAFEKAKKFDRIKIVNSVRVKALEPAFNFYGIAPAAVSDYGWRITGFVLFYVLYTIWWGFSIYFLCEGVGLLMTKSKKKSEA
jgi:hypothetical protein